MAAVISGNGLGLFNTSLTQLGLGMGGRAGVGQSRENQYVNIATGNLVLQNLDETLLDRGLGASALRTYNSRGSVSDAGQDGWVTGFERNVALVGAINAAGSTVVLRAGDGQDVVFAYSGTANLYTTTAGDGAHDSLAWNSTARTWAYTEGSTRREEIYADHADAALQGRLTQFRDLKSDGSAPAQFDVLYDSTGRVAEVRAVDATGASADAILFGYEGTTTRLTSLTTREGGVIKSQLSYGYDSAGRLSWVQTDLTPSSSADNVWNASNPASNDGLLFRTTYTYVSTTASDLRIAGIATSDGVSVGYTYEADGAGGYRVKTITQGNASDGSAQPVTFNYGAGSTDVVDGTGRTWTYQYDADKQLVAVLEPAVGGLRQKTSYSYDAAGNLTRMSQAADAGSSALLDTVYQYDANGNLTLQRDRRGNTIIRVYDATTNQLLKETRYTTPDADGLDPGFSGNTNLPSGALTTNYVYDSRSRLRFVINPAGEVREFTYATSGNGIGQVASERSYFGDAYAGTAFDEASLSAWATSSSTMPKSKSMLTAYAYDAKGRLQQSVEYATVVADTGGAGVLDAATRIRNYAYDAQGLLRQSVAVHGSSRTLAGAAPATSEVIDYVYDGMGRLLSVLGRDASNAAVSPDAANDPAGATAWDAATTLTSYAYRDSANEVRVTLDTGLIRTEARNRAGQLVSVSESGLVAGSPVVRTTQNFYDSAGRLRATQDAAGARTYYFYDQDGRVTATVDGTGAVTETRYDGIGRAIQSIGYARKVDTTSWLSGSTVVKDTLVFAANNPSPGPSQAWVATDAVNDRNGYRSYDTSGRLSTETDAAGLLTTYAWDGASRLLSKTVSQPGESLLTGRITRYYYDAADRQTAAMDAEGYLTESKFDKSGRLIEAVGYANSVRRTSRDSSLAIVKGQAGPPDRVTRYFHDGRGQQVGTLDAEGYLVEFVYDEASNQRAVKSYAKQLTGLDGTETFASLRSSALIGGRVGEQFRVVQRSFNALGQLATEVNQEGTVTRLSYDDAGRLVRTEAAQGVASEVRESNRRYDVFDNLIGELAGEGSTRLLPGMTEAQLDAIYAQYGVRHSYDLVGRRIESVDAQGNKTWYFHDSEGRQTFVVRGVAENNAGVSGALNSYGEVTETRYNAFGQVTDAIAYTGRIAIATPGSRSSVSSAIGTLAYVAATDSKRQYTYTTRGLLASVIDAEAMLTRYTYNADGELSREERAFGTAAAMTIDSLYDDRGMLTDRTEAVGSTVQRGVRQSYDAYGRVKTSTDARGSTTTYVYDRIGRQLTQTQTVQGRAETWTTAYDAFDRTISTTDALGRSTLYSYDDAARSRKVITPEGVTVTTVHNRHGQTVTVTESLGQVSTYGYDRDGNLTSSKNALDPATVNAYDTRGLLIRTTDASGRVVDLSYDAAGRVLRRVEDPAGLAVTTTYQYDAQGRQTRVTDSSGRAMAYAYTQEGRLKETAIDPAGLNLRTTYAYDALGRQITVVEGIKGASDTTAARTTSYLYDALGRRTSESVDPAGLNLTTGYAYDANDNLIRKTDGTGQVSRYYYSESDELVYAFDPLGAPTRSWYDANGRLVATRSFKQFFAPASLTDTTTIASLDAQVPVSTPYEGTYRIYDKDGLLRFALDTQNRLQEYVYDAANRLVQTRQYAGSAASVVSGLDLLSGNVVDTQITTSTLRNDVLDQITYRVYDTAGRVRYTVDALGSVTGFAYDAAGRMTAEKHYAQAAALDATLRTKLANGTATISDVAAVTTVDAAKDTVNYTVYDAAGRARYTADAFGSVKKILMDASGRIVGVRAIATAIAVDNALWAGGTLAAQADLDARLTSTILTDPRNTEQYKVYNTAGQLRFMLDVVRDAAGVATANVREWAYDGAGRVVRESAYQVPVPSTTLSSNLVALRSGTLPASTVATWVTPSIDRTTYTIFDAAGRVRYTLQQDSATTAQVTDLRYDAVGRIIKHFAYAKTIPLATEKTMAAVTAAMTVAGNDSPANYRWTRYIRDADGQLRFTIDDLGAVTEQRYDALGRVVEVRQYGTAVPTSTLAIEANVVAAVAGMTDVRSTFTGYDAAGQVVSVTDANGKTEYFAYDGVGRRTSHTDKLGQVWNYAYDAAGRLSSETSPIVSVTTVSSSGVVSTASRGIVTQWTYDAQGNVLSKTDDATGPKPRTTSYQYDNRGHQIRITFPDPGTINTSTGAIDATGVQSTIDITYNALGQAVVQKDVRGFYSYKTYDALGRLSYEVDQENNVTAYIYNAWNERTSVMRYVNALATGGSAFTSASWQAGQEISTAQMASGIVAVAGDRTMFIGYTQLGQKRAVTQIGASYYTSANAAATGNPRTEFVYDAYGDLVKESVLLEGTLGQPDAVWADTYRYYDHLSRNTLTVDAEGYVTETLYNALGEAVETTHYARALSPAVLQSISAASRPAVPAAGDDTIGYDRTTRWTYDSLGRKATESTVHFRNRSDGGLQQSTGSATFGYDNEGRLTSLTDDTGTTRTTYDALGRTLSVQEPRRGIVSLNADGVLGSTGNSLGSAALYQQLSPFTTMAYDAFGNVAALRRYANGRDGDVAAASDDSRDQVQLTRYDNQGRAVWARDPLGNVVTRRFDAADNLIEVRYALTGSEGRSSIVTTVSAYDKVGRQRSTATSRALLLNGAAQGSADDSIQNVRYNAFGELVQKGFSANAADLPLLYEYDAAGRLVASNEGGFRRTFGYNLAGHQRLESHSAFLSSAEGSVVVQTWSRIDKLGRALQSTLPSHQAQAGSTDKVTQGYDRWGNVLYTIDARGYRTDYEYNDRNQVVREIRPLAWVVSDTGVGSWMRPVNYWYYDDSGRLLATRDANGNMRSNEYDAAGRLSKSSDGIGSATLHAYDAFGNERLTQNALGYLMYKQYDRAGRVIEIGDYLPSQDGTSRGKAKLEDYVLNQNGDRISSKNALGYGSVYDYDSRHLLLHSRTALGVIADYGYDSQGRKTRESNAQSNLATYTDRDGETVRRDEQTWDYDAFGRLVDHNNLSGRDANYAYDGASGQLTSDSAAGGVAIATGDASKTYSYYANGRIREVREQNGTVYSYEYDAAGNRTFEKTVTRNGLGETQSTETRSIYDSNNRIQRVVQDDLSSGTAKRIFDLTYEYDAVGNRRHVRATSGYGPDVAPIPVTNSAPVVIATPADRAVRTDVASTFRLVFNEIFIDADRDALQLAITQANGSALPGWLTASRDAQTGEIVFTASPTGAQANQDLVVRLTATETSTGAAASTSTTFTVRVRSNTGPTALAGAWTDLYARPGQAWTQDVFAGEYFSDADLGDRLTLTLDPSVAVPAWLSVANDTPSSLRLSASAPVAGTYTVRVRATDERGASVTRDLTLRVAANAKPLVVAAPAAKTAMVDRDFGWSLGRVFRDPEGEPLTVTATLSTGAALPGWMTLDALDDQSSPALRLLGHVPASVADGTVYQLRLTATDAQGATETTTLTITARNQGPLNHVPAASYLTDTSAGQYAPWSRVVPAFTDSDGDVLTYRVASALPAGIGFDAATRTLSGTATVPGIYTITIAADDGQGGMAAVSFKLTVIANQAPTAPSIPNQAGGVGAAFLYEVPYFSDANYDALSYGASGLPPGLSFNAGNRQITGTPSAAGTYTVTVTANDGRGGTVAQSFAIAISATAPPNRAPVVQNPLVQENLDNGMRMNVSFANTFADPDNSPLTYTVSGLPSWATFNAAARTISGTASVSQDSSYLVRVTATDPGGLSVSSSFGIYVEFTEPGTNPRSETPPPEETYSTYDMGTGSQSDAMATAASIPSQVDDNWYTYDAENRIRISGGALMDGAGGAVAAGTAYARIGLVRGDINSTEALYDLAGRQVGVHTLRAGGAPPQSILDTVTLTAYDLRGRKTLDYAEQYLNLPGGTAGGGVDTKYSYDAADRLVLRQSFYPAGSEITAPYTNEHIPEGDPMPIAGWLTAAETYSYDSDNRLVAQRSLKRTDAPTWQANPSAAYVTQQKTDLGVLAEQSRTDYVKADGSSGYDDLGRLTVYRYSAKAIGYATHTYSTTFQGWESYLELKVTGTSSNGNYKATTNTLTYDGQGRLVKQVEATPLPTSQGTLEDRVRAYAYNGDGLVQQRRDGVNNASGVFTQTPVNGAKANFQFVHAGGYQQAELAEGGQVRYANGKTYNSPQIRSLNGAGGYAAGGSRVVAESGDTLQLLAQRVYGTSSLWYVLADANGLSDPDATLVAGTQLNAPSVTVSGNDATTFKPYDPNETIGSTTPSLPYIAPPPPKEHCNALATILIVVVAIIVTVYTAGAAAGAVGATATGTGATAGVAAGTAAGTAAAGGTFATGIATLAGGYGATAAVVGGAVGGFVGSVASQAVGSALGETSFSWRGALVSGAVGGATAGFGAAANAGSLGSTLQTTGSVRAGTQAAVGGVTSYAASRAVGMDASFNWTNIAASAISAAITYNIGGVPITQGGTSTGNLVNDFGGLFARGAITATTQRLFGNGRQDWGQIAADAFGNALGNAAVQGAAGWQASRIAQQDDLDWISANNPFGLDGIEGRYAAMGGKAGNVDNGFVSSYPYATASLGGVGGGSDVPDAVRQLARGSGDVGRSSAIDFTRGNALLADTRSDPYVVGAVVDGALNLDTVSVTADPAQNAWFMDLWSWAQTNRRPGPPTTGGREALVDYWSQGQRQYAPAYNAYVAKQWEGRTVSSGVSTPLGSYDEFQAKLSASDMRTFGQIGQGMYEGVANMLVELPQLALQAAPAVGLTSMLMRGDMRSPQGAWWTPYGDAPTSAGQAFGRIAGPIAAGGIEFAPLAELAGLGTAARVPFNGVRAAERWGDVPASSTVDFSGAGAVAADRIAIDASVDIPDGSFSIWDWSGYPASVPRPQGPLRLIEGEEYNAARNAANNANRAIRRDQGLVGQSVDVHEIQPVKFGGSATDPINKVVLPRDVHRQQVTPWWNQLQKDIGR